MPWGPTILIFLSLTALGIGLSALVFRGQMERLGARERRLGALAPQAAATGRALWRDRSLSTIPLLHHLLSRLPRLSDLQLVVHQAGNPCNLGSLVLMCATLACLGLVFGAWRGNQFMALGLAVLGGLAPIMWLRFLAKKRLQAFDEQFPEAVELMARALRAGHAFSSAMSMVASESEDPVAGEFAKTFEDYTFGKDLDHALADLVRRVGLQDVKFFATAVTLQRETGGNLAEILDNIGGIIRERFRLMRQVRALSAEGRLSGVILSLMAPVLLGVLMIISPGYVALLFDHPLGQTMLMVGGGFQLLGMLVIRQLVKVKG
ncbi:MAG: type II secretion system F family protein [Thermodesulfobacteriota bacterium]